MKYSHILLATDLSDASHVVVEKAKALASQFSAKLSIVHVVEPMMSYAYAYSGANDIEEEMIDHSKAQLNALSAELEISTENQHLLSGSTKYGILDLAKQVGADLIVVGSHGRHGLSKLLGSTANAVVHGAEVDVLTVRYQD